MIDFIDTIPEYVLAGIIALGVVWQAFIFLQVIALQIGGARKVTYGLGPILAALIAGLILWIIQ